MFCHWWEHTKLEKEQTIIQTKLNKLLYVMPNIALDDVPVGKDDKSNKLISQWRKKIINFRNFRNLRWNREKNRRRKSLIF